MTENRFDYTNYDDGTESIYDRKKDKYYFDIQLSEIEELMNELAEENEQLKDALNQRTEQCDKYYDENEQLKQQLKEKNDFIDEVWRKYEDAHGLSIDNTDWF